MNKENMKNEMTSFVSLKENKAKLLKLKDLVVQFNGTVSLIFNHKMILPDLQNSTYDALQTKNSSTSLITFENLDVSRDVFDLTYIGNSIYQPGNFTFTFEIRRWTETQIEVFVNFSDPLIVSRGKSHDKFVLQIKNCDLFISAESGEKIQPEHGVQSASIPI